MTKEEFLVFKNHLYCTMPSLQNLVEKSPDPEYTHGVWFKALKVFDASECEQVLSDIQIGRLKIEAYERDIIHLVIKGRVEMKRSKEVSEAENANRRQQISVAERRRNYQSPIADIHGYYMRMCEAVERWRNGEITKDAMQLIHDNILKQFAEDEKKRAESQQVAMAGSVASDFQAWR